MKNQYYIAVIVCFCLQSSLCIAQVYPYRTIDRHCKDCKELIYTGNGFELKDIKKSKNDIELRLIHYAENSSKSVTVVTRNKNVLDAFYFFKKIEMAPDPRWPDSVKHLKQWERHPYKRFHKVDNNIDSIFEKLIGAKILELPNQNDIAHNPNVGYYRSYVVEVKYKKLIRTYYFGDPNEMIRRFPEIYQYKNYKKLVDIFKEISDKFKSNHLR